mmetsp:Transcript_86620/g.187340  ORF Transcript_86620/g.187340 Transcript_86620/m.187340 type:complete len:256 (-) Transcript_86620:225-992(-)
MRSEREAGSMSERKVWLPILASTAWVCFWFVGSARAVTRSWASFLISGLATRVPISRSAALVAVRISLRTSRAASASMGTMSGRHCASCAGVPSSICRRQGTSTSRQPALIFHFLSAMPASRMGTTTEATPWPFGEMFSTMAQAALMEGAASLELSKSGTSFSRRGRTKGVHAAALASLAIAASFAAAASLPAPSKAASISCINASSAFTEGPAAATALVSFLASFLSTLAFRAARSASLAFWISISWTSFAQRT